MDSNLLKVFVTVAKENSISIAAKKLNFAQSNVTSRIKQLEKSVGFTLFHRIPKGVILTNEGEKLLPHAIEIVRKVEEAVFDMKNLTNQGRLRVGSSESNAVARIVPFLINLHKDYPKMQLELLTGTTQVMTQMLLNYEVDVAFISGHPKHNDLVVLNQFEEDIVILEPKDEKVPNVILSFKKGCTYNFFLQDYLEKNGKDGFKTLEFGSFETILGCVKAGMGRALLPLNVVKKLGYENELKIIKLDKEVANIPTCMVCRKDHVPMIKDYLEKVTL